MAISFPSNPTVGQQYTASNITWEWNGSSWASLPPSSGIGLTNLSVTQSAVGTAALSYDNSSGAFSYTPPDLSSYLTSESDTLSSVTGRGATTNTNLTFGGGLNVSGISTFQNAFFINPSSNTPATLQVETGAAGVGNTIRSSNSLDLRTNGSAFSVNLGITSAILAGGTGASQYTTLYGQGSEKLETTTSGVKITGESKSDSIALQGRSFSIQRAGAEDVLLTNTGTGGEIQIKAAGNVEIQSYQGSILLKTNTGASTSGGLSLYYATSQGAQIERLTTTSNGVDINGTTAVTGSLTVSNNITVGAAGSISGDASYAVSGKWDLGADGTNNYTFTGVGFPVTTNDPDLYLARGAVYEFVNGMGAHPFRIQSTANGSTGTQYNTGVTNNDVSNGTLKFEVPFSAPDTLYYQCTAHAAMGGKLYIYPTLR